MEHTLVKRDGQSGGVRLVVLDLEQPEVVERLANGIMVDPGCVYVFSDEWADRRVACEAFVRARAGRFERRLGARQCVVREVEKMEARVFLDAFHIQGANHLALVVFGLFVEAELVGVLSLGRHHRQGQERRVVLDRLCFRDGVQVIGGSSRMLDRARAWAEAHGYDEILSFSDNRLTPGVVYDRLGFTVDASCRPDYFYVQDGRRISKQSQRKRASGCPDGMTERSWAQARGLVRCYDAGKVRWLLPLRPSSHPTQQQDNSEQAARSNAAGISGSDIHMRGYFHSKKLGGDVYFGSSYELRCLFELDGDPDVQTFRRCEAFQTPKGRWRAPDLWIERRDGRKEIWEVKPSVMVDMPRARLQIADTALYAVSIGVCFRVWTERDSALGEDGRIIGWAREYLSRQQGDTTYEERNQRTRKAIRERHYAKEQAASVVVHCDYCQADHTVLPRTYARNVAKHDGAYVCEAMAGHIGGSKPKDHLKVTNPYAEEGKKKCSMCEQILSMDKFQKRKASWDGLSAACKPCLRAYDAVRYQKRTHANLGSPVEEIACDLHGA
jgi:hypothetical protein